MTNPMPEDRDMDQAVRSWLTDEDERPVDRNRQIGRIMGRVDETRQRRRLWPLNPFGRRAVHSATETNAPQAITGGRTTRVAPVRSAAAAGLAIFVAAALLWVATRPQAAPSLPGGWEIDPADVALFEQMVTLWAGGETDLATTLEVYADDAVYEVLGLDDYEATKGGLAIGSRMRQSPSIDWTDRQLIRLWDDVAGARRYLLVSPSNDGTACVLWVAGERVIRHDCILATSLGEEGLPTLTVVDPAAAATREKLSTPFATALDVADRTALEGVLSPQITHHVLSANQIYRLEGIDEYWSVMSWGIGRGDAANFDLPAPAGEQRWANFTDIVGGSLCVLWARDGLIVQHDCVAPGTTTVSATLAEWRED